MPEWDREAVVILAGRRKRFEAGFLASRTGAGDCFGFFQYYIWDKYTEEYAGAKKGDSAAD